MREYDLIADWYADERKPPAGVPEVEALIATLPRGASVLDVGCGNGLPLTKLMVDAGFDVLGIDSSEKMLEKFRVNLPHVRCIRSKVQDADIPHNHFDAAVSWGVIFHLPHSEQFIAFEKVAAALRPAGRFLFTSGDKGTDDAGHQGEPMNGLPFRYWSLTPDGYREALRKGGLSLINVHQDAGQNTYYLAEKL